MILYIYLVWKYFELYNLHKIIINIKNICEITGY